MDPKYHDSSDSDEHHQRRRENFQLLIATSHTLVADDEDEDATPTPRIRGPTLRRDREGGQECLMADYFCENPVYGDGLFKRRFRMSKRLALRIINDFEAQFEFFQQRYYHRGVKGFSPQQKFTAAMRQLAYGISSDAMDEYLQMSEKSARNFLHHFCKGIVQVYGPKYLRNPTYNDIIQLYDAHETRHGFRGMIGSLDCTHWSWESCPNAWRGQFQKRDHERPTIILQAIASQDLWFWHSFFSPASFNNDINVLHTSPLMSDIAEGRTPSILFVVNRTEYRHGYYLTDGIYPEWSIFVKTFTVTTDEKRSKFKRAQESSRKDVERAFGVLKKRWHIIHNPARTWNLSKLRKMMYACIILHNMILKDKGKAICDFNNYMPEFLEPPGVTEEVRAANVQVIQDPLLHNNLRHDLVEHIWQAQIEYNVEN